MTSARIDQLRGASRLVLEAATGVTEVVEAMHATIAAGPAVLGRPLARPAQQVTGALYGGIRGVMRLVGAGVDGALAAVAPLLGSSEPPPGTARAILNGVVGDHLDETSNPLAIPMGLTLDGRPLEPAAIPAEVTGKLLVLVHGSSMSDRQWLRDGHDHGAALARDLGYTPIYLRYNSGLHISTNGRNLDILLEELVSGWPVPLEDLAIIGFSMGGLVARSACQFGQVEGRDWRSRLHKLIVLGAPHHGSPVERGGQWLQLVLGVSRYSAPIARMGRLRSAGVTDLRFGYERDEHWEGDDRFALRPDRRTEVDLPAGVECYAMAATRAPLPQDRLPGDGLVTVDSALGIHARAELSLDVPADHQWIGYGMGHVDLLGSQEAYEVLKRWLSDQERAS
jgi:hypothetical protein